MKILYTDKGARYFDAVGEEIHAGDTVFLNGREEIVCPIECEGIYNAYLGTNPAWIKSGRVFQFNEDDEPMLIRRKER